MALLPRLGSAVGRAILKGPNYREQTDNIKLIFTVTENYAKRWAKKESQEYECLQDWVQHVKQMVRSKVNSLRKTVEFKRQGILELNSVKECSKELQEKYVFVPADKAANNIIVVCTRYYLEVICKELGLCPGTTSGDTFLKLWTLKKSAETTCLKSSIVFIGLQSSTKHHTSIVLSLHHLTAQQKLCLYSLPVSYLSSKGTCQTCHQSYTVAQVSMKCGFWKTALNCCRKWIASTVQR